jgi:hypothetical protein
MGKSRNIPAQKKFLQKSRQNRPVEETKLINESFKGIFFSVLVSGRIYYCMSFALVVVPLYHADVAVWQGNIMCQQ